MAQPDGLTSEPPPNSPTSGKNFLRKFFSRPNGSNGFVSPPPSQLPDNLDDDIGVPARPGMLRRMSRKVVPGLPRAQTFKRQQSESRAHLAPVEPTQDERRAVSVDRRSHGPCVVEALSGAYTNPRTSAPGFFGAFDHDGHPQYVPSLPVSPADDEILDEKMGKILHDTDKFPDDFPMHDSASVMTDTHSMTTSQYDNLIHDELESIWILNLSMHFKDRSKREKFFVTYRQDQHVWRRVTISLDYRDAPMQSLEMDLIHTKLQREKNAKIYEAIRESLPDIEFYETVTNLKLETTEGRLHVHVVEDGNEIIHFPTVAQFKHLACDRIKESDIVFDSHMSGFVYKVRVHGQVFIKKEIPSPDTIEEFIYEVNALSRLRFSSNVIQFCGVVVDDHDEYVKGLLISYADQGPLIDIIFDHCKDGNLGLPRSTKEQWARQIVQGLSDIHESGFVQGDFTLSNIVVDDMGDAKIIDINRRGCPIGWEPPEATPLIESGQRISMYIGVKSDLFQLGMVLWALAMEEDEPDLQGRPLVLGPEVNVSDWYRQVTEICLSNEPRMRLQASSLLRMIPPIANDYDPRRPDQMPISVDDGNSLQEYLVDGYHEDGHPRIRTIEPPNRWSNGGRTYVDGASAYEPYYYTRGRSPPSPLPSNVDRCESPHGRYSMSAWAANRDIPPSYSDVGADEVTPDDVSQQATPTVTTENTEKKTLAGPDSLDEPGIMVEREADQAAATESWEGEETPRDGEAQDVFSSAVGEPVASQTDDAVQHIEAKLGTTDAQDEVNEHATVVKAPEVEASPVFALEVTPDTDVREKTVEQPPTVSVHLPEEPPRDGSCVKETDGSLHGEKGTMKTNELSGTTEKLATEQVSDPGPEGTEWNPSGDTAPYSEANKREEISIPAGSSQEPGKPTLEDEQPPTTPQPTKAVEPVPAELVPLPSDSNPDTTDSPKQTRLPDSLVGIGSGYMMTDDDLTRDMSILDDDDFDAAKREEASPAVMITTDANTIT